MYIASLAVSAVSSMLLSAQRLALVDIDVLERELLKVYRLAL
jgi:hypothetical protein